MSLISISIFELVQSVVVEDFGGCEGLTSLYRSQSVVVQVSVGCEVEGFCIFVPPVKYRGFASFVGVSIFFRVSRK